MKALFSFIKNRTILRFSQKSRLSKLTAREKKILELVLNNQSYIEIGKELGIKRSTVSKHASNIFKKMKCKNRESLETLFN